MQKSCLQKSFYRWDAAHVWLRLRNHGRRTLITAIKQEKDKHRRPLMPGHLKCLRSVNIFAHKALWWWPRLLWHGSGRLCKHSQFNLPLQNAERVSIGAVRYLFFLRAPAVPGSLVTVGGAAVAPLSLGAAVLFLDRRCPAAATELRLMWSEI